MKSIRVTIKPEHFLSATPIMRGGDPLGMALRDEGHDVENVGQDKVYIREGTLIPKRISIYYIPTDKWGGYSSPYPPGYIDRLCQKAKRSLESIPTIELQLVNIYNQKT